MSKAITFWELIKANKIEVPVIQRDYAQGREENKVNAIRKDFVKDLISSLYDDDKSLHLGFVYGKIDGKDKHLERERNKRAIENILNAVEGYAQQLNMRIQTDIQTLSDGKTDDANLPIFIPLDGQQRLTTLYLLHWYLVVFSKEGKATNLKILDHFTYKTRKSSLEFCDAICELKNVENLEETELKLSVTIANNNWFRKAWIKDSTVKGMLVMLDAIHLELSEKKDENQLLNRLISENLPVITFDFLDLYELNQTDELYVKMNARGKQLTEFEHFKAWLQNYISTKKVDCNEEPVLLNALIIQQNWKQELDRTWLDMFWSHKEDGVYIIDNVIYNAFKQIVLFDYIATSEKNEDTLAFSKAVRDKAFIPFANYEENKFFNESTLNFLFTSLSILADKTKIDKYNSWLEDITHESFFGKRLDIAAFLLNNDKNPDRDESVFYYSFLLFLTSDGDKNSEIQFKNWMRFTRNIVFNTYIQNPENFFDAIKAIYGLQSNMHSINEYIIASKPQITFFGKASEQEIIKAKLFTSNEEWKTFIIQNENHVYFKGDINFILELSKIDEKYNLLIFIKYGAICSLLFSDEIRNHSQNLLQRALFTCGNYLPEVGSNRLIPLSNGESLRARRDNWQKVFNNLNNLNVLKSLCDEIRGDLVTVETKLNELINNYDAQDWISFFVKSSKVINYCTKGFIRWVNENEISLMKTSRIYGTHAELRSYFYYEENIKEHIKKSPFKKVIYFSNKMSQYEFPVVRFINWNFEGQNYLLEFTYLRNGKYLFQLMNHERNVVISDTIIERLSALQWVVLENKFQAKIEVSKEDDLLPKLQVVLNELAIIKTQSVN